MTKAFYYRAGMEPTIEFLSFMGTDFNIRYDKFEVLSTTSCGVWIKYYNEKEKKFINNGHRKRFAYSTQEEALVALGFRLKACKRILASRLLQVEEELKSYDRIVGNQPQCES